VSDCAPTIGARNIDRDNSAALRLPPILVCHFDPPMINL
jgi:hypothetical protein